MAGWPIAQGVRRLEGGAKEKSTMSTAQTTAPAVPSGEFCSSGQSILLDPSDPSAYWTVAQVAQALGLTPRGVRKSIETGRLKACKPAWLGMWLVRADTVARLIEAKGVRHG